ncbi:MAG TPA: pyridoxamine 5'-phosphate oxidase family protein, partial [Thermoanaerobaculia bacterium]|nr:pyridoxamine 5'-phosphate oxidase family protein [Thermoanaerobaculia bacterium]
MPRARFRSRASHAHRDGARGRRAGRHPIWFLFEEGAIWFTPRKRSSWFANLQRDPRVALSIDEQPPSYRKVGRAELVFDLGEDDAWRDRYRSIACRYVSPEAADAYIEDTIDQPRALY